MSKKRKVIYGIVVVFGIIVLMDILTDNAPPAPEPTPTATPCPTTEEAAYMNAFTEEMEVIIEASGQLGPLLERFHPSDRSEDWVLATGAAIVMLEDSAGEIRALEPPASLTEIGDLHEAMAVRLLVAMDELTYGIDNLDESAVDEFSELIEQATDDLDQANALVEAYCP